MSERPERRNGGAEGNGAAVGVAEHGAVPVTVTVTARGELLDRRRVDLTRDLPTHPYHQEGSRAMGRYLNSYRAQRGA